MKTAAAAAGTFGSTKADAFRNIERLLIKTGDPAADAANEALLRSPEGQRVLVEMAAAARDTLPGKLGQVETARALMQVSICRSISLAFDAASDGMNSSELAYETASLTIGISPLDR